MGKNNQSISEYEHRNQTVLKRITNGRRPFHSVQLNPVLTECIRVFLPWSVHIFILVHVHAACMLLHVPSIASTQTFCTILQPQFHNCLETILLHVTSFKTQNMLTKHFSMYHSLQKLSYPLSPTSP